jgi:hypothetical protein
MMNSDAYIRQRADEKKRATAAIATALATIDGEQREPDPWEREHLYIAVMSAFHGRYQLAAAYAEKALTPTDDRDPFAGDLGLDDCDLAAFRILLSNAESTPPKTNVGK